MMDLKSYGLFLAICLSIFLLGIRCSGGSTESDAGGAGDAAMGDAGDAAMVDDAAGDTDADGDSDSDADADAGGDADTDADGDGDGDGGIDGGQKCTPGTDECGWGRWCDRRC